MNRDAPGKIPVRFSVCIPVYNSGSLCRDAIQSALNQSYEHYEIVVVNDASTDDTGRHIDEYRGHPRVKIFHNFTNLGLAGNWNRCLQEASNPYIAFVHHDDTLMPDALERAAEILSRHEDVGVLAFMAQGADRRPLMGRISSEDYFEYIFPMLRVPPPSETIFFKAPNLAYDLSMKYAAEADIYLTLCQLGFAAYHASFVGCVRNPRSWSGSVSDQAMYSGIEFEDAFYIYRKYYQSRLAHYDLLKRSVERMFLRLCDRYAMGLTFGSSSRNVAKLKAAIVRHMEDLQDVGLSARDITTIRLEVPVFLAYRVLFRLLQRLRQVVKRRLAETWSKFRTLVDRLVFCANVYSNRRQEPLWSATVMLKYLINGQYFPEVEEVDYRPDIEITSDERFKYATFRNIRIAYNGLWPASRLLENMNSILNEQTEIGARRSPHKYIEQVSDSWVVYDLGAAEGYQSKLWSRTARMLVLFEPDRLFFDALQQTFAGECNEGSVVLINKGVSSTKKIVQKGDTVMHFETLPDIIDDHHLPLPDVLKIDIEGDEIGVLRSLSAEIVNNIKLFQIASYHRPSDAANIANFFSNIPGHGEFTDGVIIFNRDGSDEGTSSMLYQPVIRRCLYTHYR